MGREEGSWRVRRLGGEQKRPTERCDARTPLSDLNRMNLFSFDAGEADWT